jgi:CRP-like cAMP-binding protein
MPLGAIGPIATAAVPPVRGDTGEPAESKVAKYCDILRSIPIFHGLPEDALTRLAPSLKYANFARGEYIVRQGDESGSMYVVVQGSVDVSIEGDGGTSVLIAKLDAGQFFGELSVFTGEKRTANVTATTAVECLVIDKPSLMGMFDWRPELAEDIAEIIVQRQASLAASKELLAAQQSGEILQKIHSFFGIGSETRVH